MNRNLLKLSCFLLTTVSSPFLMADDVYGNRVIPSRDLALWEQNQEAMHRGVEAVPKCLHRGCYAPEVYGQPVLVDQGGMHQALGFSDDGTVLQLEDDSQWIIDRYDVLKMFGWKSGDVLTVLPNRDLLGRSEYKIQNFSTGDIVSATLDRGPSVASAYTKQVAALDFYLDDVYLTDGSVWTTSWADSILLKHWRAGDYVIVGTNNGVFSSTYEAILINVTLNRYIVASRR